eukprot:SAG11_NODE_2511_length_3268_cov_4.738403_3_plen_78_part_00
MMDLWGGLDGRVLDVMIDLWGGLDGRVLDVMKDLWGGLDGLHATVGAGHECRMRGELTAMQFGVGIHLRRARGIPRF